MKIWFTWRISTELILCHNSSPRKSLINKTRSERTHTLKATWPCYYLTNSYFPLPIPATHLLLSKGLHKSTSPRKYKYYMTIPSPFELLLRHTKYTGHKSEQASLLLKMQSLYVKCSPILPLGLLREHMYTLPDSHQTAFLCKYLSDTPSTLTQERTENSHLYAFIGLSKNL